MTKSIPQKPLLYTGVCVMIAIGILLRLLASQGELWLDEVWSLMMSHLDVQIWTDVFTEIHSYNNHHLNTLYLSFFGLLEPYYIYRMASVVLGSIFLVILCIDTFKRNVWQGVTVTLLFSFSFAMIRYASEARGYGPMLLFGLLALLALRAYLKKPSPTLAVIYGISCSIAFLWQLTFLALFIPLGVLATLTLMQKEDPALAIQNLIWLHIMPILTIAALYWADLRFVVQNETPPITLRELFTSTVLLALGKEVKIWEATLLALIVLGWVVRELWLRARTDRTEALFYASGILVSPLLILAVFSPDGLYARHFLGSIFLLLLFTGETLGRKMEAGPGGTAFALLCCTAFLGINLSTTWNLIKYGRGEYAVVLQYLNDRTLEPTVTVGSDTSPRTALLLSYYTPRLRDPKAFMNVPADQAKFDPPLWHLIEKEDRDGMEHPPENVQRHDRTYQFVEEASGNGTHWMVFKRAL